MAGGAGQPLRGRHDECEALELAGAEQKRLMVALTAATQPGDLATLETVFT